MTSHTITLADDDYRIIRGALRMAVKSILEGNHSASAEKQLFIVRAYIAFCAPTHMEEELYKPAQAFVAELNKYTLMLDEILQLPEPKEEPQELCFPKTIKMVLDKNIKLYLNGCKIHLSLAGKLSLVAPEYGGGYYGSFHRDGTFRPTASCKKEYIEQLQAVEERGLEAVKEIGKLTGNCCICGRTLTNEGSIEEGIGPICAGKAFGV